MPIREPDNVAPAAPSPRHLDERAQFQKMFEYAQRVARRLAPSCDASVIASDYCNRVYASWLETPADQRKPITRGNIFGGMTWECREAAHVQRTHDKWEFRSLQERGVLAMTHELPRVHRLQFAGRVALPDQIGGWSADTELIDREWHRVVRFGIRRMPQPRRAIMWYRVFGDLTLEEIAAEMDKTLGTVAWHVFKGRRELEALVRRFERGDAMPRDIAEQLRKEYI